MEADLDDLYQRLSLTEQENEAVVVESGDLEESSLCNGKGLVLSLFTEKHFNREAFKVTMKRAWRLVRGVKFRDLHSNIFLANFEDLRDKEKVLREGPWSFDKHLLLVQEVDGNKQVQQIKIREASFWVRLHDLPLRARNDRVGHRIGAKIGRVLEVDLDSGELAWGDFLRVRVSLDIRKPLLRGTRFSMGFEDSCWVRFSYERLSTFCFYCGCLGHGDRECERKTQAVPGASDDSFPYGSWLRASSYGDLFRDGRTWTQRVGL
ncbi:uncharacterized protein LOC122316216 [Carya illinoinensis]|uniref:uncharacterized protein LOC122316216 n=1 Tax=Carya illinoinensis TaxID=32201 RepID=UPI001C719178|nr:uncharacterized protein LOC122316216 [Carya illinoinensis]